MRNLKRALSLGLTAAMVSGLMVMGSSAASYADVTSEQNQEAIEVLKTVGIMTGDEKGDFNPASKVTRNEMAVVMCNLLDYTVASYKGTSPFTDVPAWAEPYVAACYTNGIIAGYSKTVFGGSDSVTTGQAALMLEKALGYFQYSGDFGDDWLVETTKNGSKAGLFDGVDTGATDALTRNDLAQMVLNALEANTVDAEKNGSDITVGDIVISGSKATYTARTGSDSKYGKINNTKVDGKYTIQLGEDLYDGDLAKSANTSDDFGRPAAKWTYNNKEIGTYAKKADATYTAGVEKQDIYDVVGSEVYNDLKNGDADFTVVVDGVTQEDAVLSDYIARNSSADAGAKDDDGVLFIKKGATTEVYVDDDTNDVVIAVINTYVAQVDGDYDEDDEELDLDALDDSPVKADSMTLSADDFDYLDSYSDEDYVLVTVADGEIKTIQKAETVNGTVTAYTQKKNVTVDGTKYEYSKNYTNAVNNDMSYDLNKEYTLVLDTNGYVIYSDASDSTEDYVYVAALKETVGAKTNLEADAYFTDGTNKVIVVDNSGDGDDEVNDKTATGWFTFREKSNEKYELTPVETATQVKGEVADKTQITTSGSATVVSGSDKVRANSATIFVVNDDDDITVYTGIKNVPDIIAGSEKAYVATVLDGSYADVVYISGGNLIISGDSGDRVYILDKAPDASVDSDDNDYYEYDAIVNGKVTTVKANDKGIFTTVGLYQNVSYDSNDYVNRAKLVEDDTNDDFKAYTLTDSKIDYSKTVLSFEGAGADDADVNLTLADGYKIFVNDDGDGKTTTPSKLARDYADGYTGTIYVYENDDDEAVEVYVVDQTADKDDDKDTADVVVKVEKNTLTRSNDTTLTATVTVSKQVGGHALFQLQSQSGNGNWRDVGDPVEVGFQNDTATHTFTVPAATGGVWYRLVVTSAGDMVSGEDTVTFQENTSKEVF